MKSGFHTPGDDQLSGWTEKKLQGTPKARLGPKKLLSTVRWSPAGLTHYSFLNPGETIPSEKYTQQISEMHRKLQCLRPELVPIPSTTTLTARNTTISSKVEQNGPQSCLIRDIHQNSHQPTTTSSSISTTFCRENCFTTIRRQKMLSKSSWNPKAQIFFFHLFLLVGRSTDIYATGINSYFLLAKMC